MNAKPKTELNRCVFVQKRNSVNGALVMFLIACGPGPIATDNEQRSKSHLTIHSTIMQYFEAIHSHFA